MICINFKHVHVDGKNHGSIGLSILLRETVRDHPVLTCLNMEVSEIGDPQSHVVWILNCSNIFDLGVSPIFRKPLPLATWRAHVLTGDPHRSSTRSPGFGMADLHVLEQNCEWVLLRWECVYFHPKSWVVIRTNESKTPHTQEKHKPLDSTSRMVQFILLLALAMKNIQHIKYTCVCCCISVCL